MWHLRSSTSHLSLIYDTSSGISTSLTELSVKSIPHYNNWHKAFLKKNQNQSHSHELEKSLHPQACNLIWNNDQCGLYSDEVFCVPQFDSFSLCNIFKMNTDSLIVYISLCSVYHTKFRQNQPQSFVSPVLGDRLSFPSPDILLFSLPLCANFSKSRIQEWMQSFFFLSCAFLSSCVTHF